VAGSREQLDELIAASAPDRHDLELQRAARDIEQRLFATRTRPMTLARYILLREVARGGGGIVFSAFDPELDRKVAIKLIHSGTGESAQERRNRLLREAQAMARLDHPNVIPVHDVGTYSPHDLRIDDGRRADIPERGVFVVMELADGIDLRAWLREGKRSRGEVVAVFRDAAAGLVAAHRAGLVHRDFKPSNVMVGTDGRVRVLDFGLVRTVSGSSSDASSSSNRLEGVAKPITGHGVVVGTPAYMSPEQHRGGDVDERCDQYCFCAALYEGVYGRLPFPQRTIAELREAKETGAFERRPDPAVPRWLDRLIAIGLAPDPAQRHASMAVIHAELGRDHSRVLRWSAGAFVLVGAAIAVLVVGSASDPCAELDAELEGIWDAPTRSAVEAAFLATDVPYAEQSARTVSDDLDRYAEGWLAARKQVCEAGTRATAETGRAMLCLDRRLTRVGGLTQLFTTADAKLVEGAAAAVADLPAVEPCAERAASTHAPDASREQALAVEAEIARSAALGHAVRYDEALRLARSAVELAEGIDEPIVLGRALDQLARIHSSRAEYVEAEAAARRAVVAAERGLDSELAVACLQRLAFIVGYGRSRYEEGLQLVELAQAKLDGLGLDDQARRQLLVTRARIHERGGQHREGLADLEQALALEEASATERPTVIADILNNIGVAHDRLGDYEAALDYYERALEARRFLGEGHPDVGNGLGNVGIALSSVGRWREAVAALEEGLAITEAALGVDHPTAAWIESNLGSVYLTLGRYEEAEERVRSARRARERTLGLDHPITAMASGTLSAVLVARGRGEEALALARHEVEIAEQHATNAFGLARALHNQALALAAVGRHADALSAYARSEALYTEAAGAEHPQLADVLGHRGESELALGDAQAATKVLERALAIGLAGKVPDLDLASTRFALARALADRDPQRATSLAEEARAALQRDAPARAELAQVIRWSEAHRRDR
jgi:serine/threonine protein kinase/tetratricopeptide (TPR) repeat protein